MSGKIIKNSGENMQLNARQVFDPSPHFFEGVTHKLSKIKPIFTTQVKLTNG